MTNHRSASHSSPRLRWAVIGPVAGLLLVALMYAAFVWRACEIQGLDGFVSSFLAFHTRDGC